MDIVHQERALGHILLYKKEDHYDACTPSQVTEETSTLSVNVSETQGNHSCSVEGSSTDNKFSEYDIKFGHVNARNLYPKLDEINAIVMKHDLIFSVSGKHGFTVKIRNGLMFDEVEAIWLELNENGQRYLISCIYRPPSSSQAYYNEIIDMYERAQLDDIPIISMGDLNYYYKLDESLSNTRIHYIEMAYEMTPTDIATHQRDERYIYHAGHNFGIPSWSSCK